LKVFPFLKAITWLTIIVVCSSCPNTSPKSALLTQQLNALFEKWNQNTPGGVLTVAQNGQIIYNKAFGMADLEHDIPNTTNTIFESGSVAKQFTAAAILLLVLDKKLSLEDDVRKYLPELPNYGQKITIDHLLHHTSGLRDWGAIATISGWERGKRVYTQADALDIICRQKSLNFPPGDQFSYSNSNYNLLAILVERVSKESFAEFTRKRIFKLMEMHHTSWRDNYRSVVKNRAIAYTKSGNNYLATMPFENAHGNGGLLTTTTDLIRWTRNFRTLQLKGAAFTKLQVQCGKLNNGLAIAYAGGFFIRNYTDVLEFSHGGYTAGYRAWLAYYPNQDISVAYLSNDGNVSPEKMGAQIAEIVLDKKLETPIGKTIPLGRSVLQPHTGRYKNLRNDELFELELKEEKLRLKSGQVLHATAPNIFHWGANRMIFTKDLQQVTVYTGNGDSATYERKMPFLPAANELPPYLGTYRSTEAETSLLIELHNGSLRTFVKPAGYFLLTPIYKDAFITTNNSLLQFTRNKKGAVTGFTMSVARARGVWFEKG